MTPRDDPAGAPPAANEPVRLFYDHVVDEAELRRALDIQGLDQEVAILRIKLHDHLDKHPEDQALMLKSVDSIVRAVSARYRMSSKRTDDFASACAAVFDAVSNQFA
jgi:hypothetical protein